MQFYIEGVRAWSGRPTRGVLVGLTKKRPYQIIVAEPTDHHLYEAEIQNRHVLDEIARRFKEDDWLAPWETDPVRI